MPPAIQRLVKEGASLSADDAAVLELCLAERPDDLDARARLLGYSQASHQAAYNAGSISLMRRNTSLHDGRVRHALWLAANAPLAPLAAHPLMHFRMAEPVYAELSAIWRKRAAASPPDATLLAHAIAFFWFANETFADELLTRAERLFPDDGRWRSFRRDRRAVELGFECRLQRVRVRGHVPGGDDGTSGGQTQDDQIERNLDEIDQLLREDGDPIIAAELRDIASKFAFDRGRIDRARAHAEQMLVSGASDPSPEFSDEAHNGHLLLGRIALREGDLERAKAHLILAGRSGATGLVQVFGPDMHLAKDLLVRGERDAVTRYLSLCRAFWERGPTDEWIAQIRAGEFPNFGRNLER